MFNSTYHHLNMQYRGLIEYLSNHLTLFATVHHHTTRVKQIRFIFAVSNLKKKKNILGNKGGVSFWRS